MATTHATHNEITILSRILGDENGRFSEDLARYILEVGFSKSDQARMHELAVRNQDGQLSTDESEELLAFGKAGDLLSILKSKARLTLGSKQGSLTNARG